MPHTFKIHDVLHSLVPPAPLNVVVVRFDSTSIGVSWTKFTLVELKGIANYIVTYNIIIGSRKRQELGGTITVPWMENRVIISNLQPGAEYDITVSTSTSSGMSGSCGHMMLNIIYVSVYLIYVIISTCQSCWGW